MIKYTLEKRVLAFIAVALIFTYSYQYYHNQQSDRYINEAMEETNKSVNRYVMMLNNSQHEIEGLKNNLIHSQAMYAAVTNHNESLEQQIDVISQFWKERYIKVNDELFNLKYHTNNVNGV